MQKERGASRILSLHEEIEREAREIEKEMSRHPELDNIQVTEEMDAALLKKIQAYEQDLEEEREAVKKVEENLRKNHYLSASAEDSVHASTANAAGHAGKHAGAGNAVRRFKVPGDSVEFAAELMPEIPRGFVLGNRDAGDVRASRKIGARETAAGYVGYMGPKAPGYGESMQAGVSAYGDNMETTVCGYRDNIEGTVSGYRGNMEETASGYRENMEETASGYRGNIEAAAAGYGENIEAAGAENVVEWPKDEYVAEPGDVTGNVAGSAAEGAGEEKVLYRRKKKKYILVSLAAVLLIVLGVGGTSVGSKSHWKVLWEAVTGEPMNGIDTEDMNSTVSEDVDEIAVFREIEDKLHIQPVRMKYSPDNMKLADYEIQEDVLKAQLLYKYKDETIRYFLYMNDTDSSIGQNEEDNKIDEYTVFVNGVEINVEEFKVLDSAENRQIASFEYKGVHYQLKGAMEKAEFQKILENLYFF